MTPRMKRRDRGGSILLKIPYVGGWNLICYPSASSIRAPFEPFLAVSPPMGSNFRSGFFYKGDPLSYPLSFLGGRENTSEERQIYAAWKAYLNGKIKEATDNLYRALRTCAQASNPNPPPRFSVNQALTILKEAKSGRPEILKLVEKLTSIQKLRESAQNVDLKRLFSDLP